MITYYNLHSICIHMVKLNHYYAYCKNLNDKKWIIMTHVSDL